MFNVSRELFVVQLLTTRLVPKEPHKLIRREILADTV